MASKTGRAAKTATDALEILWEEGFFAAAKKLRTITENLAKRGNNFNTPEMGMALKRARYLTRRGSAGKYEYIQKYPYTVVAEELAKAAEKGRARKAR